MSEAALERFTSHTHSTAYRQDHDEVVQESKTNKGEALDERNWA